MDRAELEKRYITARRRAIALDFAHLNDVQREAVMATQGPLLLLAGAGSGKTTVLINRIANLLKYGCGSDSQHVPDGATGDDLALLESYAGAGDGAGVGDSAEAVGRLGAGGGPKFGAGAGVGGGSGGSAGAVDRPSGAMDLTPGCAQSEVRRLCAVDPVEPWRIIAITFTNKAAGEMKQRLGKMLGPGAEDIWASTFHSACVRILRRDIDALGYDRSFAIYDMSDTASLMKRILKDLNIEERYLPHKTVLGYISRAKDSMISANDFIASAGQTRDSRRKVVGRAYAEYETRLKASNALDFDDLILLTVILFRDNPDILQHYQNRFKYVLVDEYQDTNNLQYLLVSSLAGGYSNICVVGDDDQSIYKFRGATIENILNFEKHFDDARVIRLEQNYRSTGYILNAANDVISNNRSRKGKKLWTESILGEKTELHIVSDEREEAQFVADAIISGAAAGRGWSEHAVLYRMNAQSNQLETAFKRSGIPYRVFGGTGFYERAEIKDMLAYLCVIHNPSDDVRLLRIINDPPRGIGDTTVGRLTALAAEMGKPVFEIIEESHEHDALKASAGRLHLFAEMINDLRALSSAAPLDELYDSLIGRTGYIRMLEEKGTDENIARIENVRELKTNIIAFMNQQGGSLFDFLSETALFTDLDRDDQSSDRVLMMTMHSAKGLEFDTVFIVGAEEGIFPSSRSIDSPEDIEEERRLCYVAMTRAMRMLYFTSAQRRMLFGKTSSAQPSRFLDEIGYDNISIHEPLHRFQDFDYRGFDYRDTDTGFSYGSRAHAQRADSYNAPYSPAPRSSTPYSPAPRSPTPQARVSPHLTHAPENPQRILNLTPQAQRTSGTLPRPPGDPEPPAQSAGLPKLKKGDTISHKAFGRGVVTGISKAGGDALLEIAFEKEGTKRMLLKSAARYIKIHKNV